MKNYVWICILFVAAACSNPQKEKQEKKEAMSIEEKKALSVAFDYQGHRGARGLMPENTVAAMLLALEYPITTLEMDVVITKDKKVVLSHEPFFNHEITTKPNGDLVNSEEERTLNIYQMLYEDVKGYDVGSRPHPRFPQQKKLSAYKPLLSQVIDSVDEYITANNRSAPYYNIETKLLPISDNIYHPEPSEFVELLMGVIKEKGIENRTIIQSFDFRTLQYLKQHYPYMGTAMLIEGNDERTFEQQIADLGFVPAIYSPEYSLVTPAIIQKCKEQKMRIIPWTVNDAAAIKRLKELGVDGIISDYPNLFTE